MALDLRIAEYGIFGVQLQVENNKNIAKIVFLKGRKGLQKIFSSERYGLAKAWKKLKIISLLLTVMFLFIASTTAVGLINISEHAFLGIVFLIVSAASGFAFTQVKSVRHKIKHQADSLLLVFDQMAEAVFISASNGKICSVNPACSKLLNYSESELLGKFLQDFSSDPKQLNINKLECIDNVSQFECVLVRKSGEHFYAEVLRQVLADKRILDIVRDISGHKAEQQRIEDLVDELQFQRDLIEERSAELVVLSAQLEESESKQKELNAEKDKFFSILAHDLKSPFAGIMGYSSLLLDEFESLSKEEMKEFITSLDKLSKNTFKLIENLLDWSRLQTGKMNCTPAMLQLYEAVLYAESLVSANAERKEIKIINQINVEPYVNADERMMNSILENLLSNAIKFTPRGGNITISSLPVNGFHEITVADTGIGMSAEVIEKIFRIDANHTSLGTEHEKGTGLGVILCKEMIERQGGNLKVESELGIGTKFKFILPAWRNE
ncbi:MAG: response regulator receiver [Ignavibacteria bacterium]|nr:MAG: response regulator receiver [Ignavibacteria bacterium]KAF0160733.1 MAG: response regulator receiver [Ignavibacteria bacterium]